MYTFTGAIAILASLIGVTSAIAWSSTSYNSTTQLCCNGNVLQKGNHDSCCGSKPYQYETALCCSDQLFPIKENSSMACCYDYDSKNATAYDDTTEVCCDGAIVPQQDQKDETSCCGKKLYNYETETCCGRTIVEGSVDCCGDMPYDVSSDVCCSSYDTSDKEWVYSTVALEGSATQCCNGEAYDPEEKVCCDDTLADLPEGVEDASSVGCCGSVPFSYSEHTCCTEWIEDEESGKTEYRYHLPENTEGKTSCCGAKLFDYNTEVCCDQKTSVVAELPADADKDDRYVCCGEGIAYNYRKQLCLDDKVVDKPFHFARVCGKDIFNFNKQSCCNDVAYDDDGPKQCCYGTNSLYNQDEEICCLKQVIKRSDADKSNGNDGCCTMVYN